MNSQFLTSADGLALRLRTWEAHGTARGQVLVVHGLGEHGGRHAGLAAALQAHGWRVLAHDHRGHGESAGPRGVIARDDSLLDDLSLVIDLARRALDGPLVLLGHSLGGLVAARFVAEALAPAPAAWSRRVEALVLSSPAIDAGLTSVQRMLVAVASRLAPALALGNGLDPHAISRDPAVVQAYVNDPLVHDRISGRLARFIADGGPAVLAAAPGWTVPTLLMWAGADRCVAPAGSERLAAALPREQVTARAWPGLAHEIFHEPEREEVLVTLDSWLDQRFPSAV
jgi:alpha-beta hydrolase superfamily lysophospholipase